MAGVEEQLGGQLPGLVDGGRLVFLVSSWCLLGVDMVSTWCPLGVPLVYLEEEGEEGEVPSCGQQ